MHAEDAQAVRDISLFSSLNDEHFDDLVKMSYLQSFPAHVQLIDESDPADFLHILVEGRVELFGSANDRETTMFIVEPVSTFNLSAVLEDAIYLMSARTLEKSRVLMIPAVNARTVMEADSSFAHSMVMELAKRYRNVINALKEQKLRSGLERLANYILRAKHQAKKGAPVELAIDKRTLAALLGMTPEYLSRAFKKLGEYGVESHGNQISVKNIHKLRTLAKPHPLIDREEE